MNYLKRAAIIFSFGGAMYAFLEILYRGYTHWTMAVTGGLCCMGLSGINSRLGRLNLFLRALLGATLITAAEFTVGCLVNKVLDWDVWDYSERKFQLLGQISLKASGYWYALSLCFMWLRHVLPGKLQGLPRKKSA